MSKVVRLHRHRRQLPVSLEDDYRPERMLGAALMGVVAMLGVAVLIWIVRHAF